MNDDASAIGAPTGQGLRDWTESLKDPVLFSLTAHAPDAIMVLDLDGRIRFINWTAGGLSIEKVLGTEVYGYVPADQRAAMRECFDSVKTTHKASTYQNVYTNPDDRTISFWDSRVAPVLQAGEVVALVVISSDVTERREAAAQREMLFAVSLDMLCVAGFDGFFKRINPAFQKTLQYTKEELLSRAYADFVHPDDVLRTQLASEALSQGRDVVDFENRYRRKDGQYRTLSWRGTADRAAKMIFAVARDVTEQRALELQLRQSQKMDAIGQLAGGLAHDFNNLLLAIMGNTEAAQLQLGAEHEVAEHLTDIARASERASGLVKELLALGSRRPSQVLPLEINQFLASLATTLRRLVPASIELTLVPQRETIVVSADAAQLEQVLLNLCLNARDAMPAGGQLTLEAQTQHDDQAAGHELGAAPGTYAVISVTDTGRGMSPEVRERIFEPFFTTKDPGKGTGLGLATAYAIVKQHNGSLQVQSQPGMGSCFRIYLPTSAAATAEVAARLQTPLPVGYGTVLLAEDEELVKRAVTSILRSAGYDVVGVANGLEALAVLESGRHIDLVLLDIVMPKLGGLPTLMRIKERWPNVKVVLSSGYHDGTGGAVPPGTRVLEKPYRAEDLLSCLSEALGT